MTPRDSVIVILNFKGWTMSLNEGTVLLGCIKLVQDDLQVVYKQFFNVNAVLHQNN